MIKNSPKVTVFTNEMGKLHRHDGPAYIDGPRQEWWFNGELHRLDGPAIIVEDTGLRHWFVHGNCVTDQIEEWARERGVNHRDMSDAEKAMLVMEWAMRFKELENG